ncbi:hypothetical protein HU200_045625 [Digitaria exilis]|uniref:NAC domain-containing protein n=1 Tax=Digitaria exilis TaxID=1010633 RepID=A0A835EBY4_9POAL|nr:hypothetical protein HU200_045625 [Digitaria exilis]CAB3459005.1 unnamed protein product [Digitaria exilis]
MAGEMPLPPGFRFHPTDEELIVHYLRSRAANAGCPVPIIADVDIYKFDPWELPGKAVYGDGGEYYFFSPRDRKYPNGIRPNRAAGSGYWKATGTDKPIHHTATGDTVGVKKALVFYKGRPPRGTKTNWIMHEYRLANTTTTTLAAASYRPPSKFGNVSMRLDDWVLCRIYKKSGQASPMVPPLADYDHPDHYDETSSGFDDICSSFVYAPTSSGGSSTTATSAAVIMQQQPRLPKIPSISDLFDEYALAQIFDAPVPADHLAVHPSLNHLLAVGDSDDLTTIYDSPSSPATAAAGKRKAATAIPADVCAAGTPKRINHGSCFEAPQPASGLPAAPSVLGALNHHMLPQF